jgi:hypothetical protein
VVMSFARMGARMNETRSSTKKQAKGVITALSVPSRGKKGGVRA